MGRLAVEVDRSMLGQKLAADPESRLFVSDDLDDTRARISAVMQPHVLTPLGRSKPFDARMSFLPLPGMGVGTIAFGEMALQLDEIEDYHLLIFCIRGQAQFSTRRGELSVGGLRGICLAPGERVRARFSAECEQLVVRIDAASMRRFSPVPEPAFRAEIDLAAPSLQPWARLADLMTNDASTLSMLRRNDAIGRQYAQLFISALLDGHGPVEGRHRAGPVPATVKRGESFIDAHLADPVTLEDIAAAAGVPVRTLLHSFRTFRGTSPMRHLRDRRLDHAMKLLRETSGGATVATIAMASGFNHLGRFSHEFRARFGESPSACLRRTGPAPRAH